jgi:hypothetical protein
MEWDGSEKIIRLFHEEIVMILDYCQREGRNVPNAAKEVEIFISLAQGVAEAD